MKVFHCTPDKENPLRVFGLNPYYDGEGFSKCHKAIRDEIRHIAPFGVRSCGGRICFRTNAHTFTLRMTIAHLCYDIGMSTYSCSSADVYIGARPTSFFAGLLNPPGEMREKDNVTAERTFVKSGEMEDVTVFLPRNETVTAFSVEIDDDAVLEAPTPYRNAHPVAFYGSSITEGGCSTRVGCNYISILSNRLNIDVLNYGFSGSARGDLAFADYIIAQNPSIFVYDYDHNAPTPEFLADTHAPFFWRVRNALPHLPIIMMSRPDYLRDEDAARRRAIIKKTYDDAVASGDKLVRFVDGGKFFPDHLTAVCSLDTVHPNDTGFLMMADALTPYLNEFLC
ncbi:MAG: hypothetical protein IJ449_02690 [Clostridia bacterium]|nr:hypothetical protein [Clostridia bacterium]